MSAAKDLSRRLAARAEDFCRAYLPKGRRFGHYWSVGDVAGNPGRSLYVRLSGRDAGRWRDAATGEHGDLLDLLLLNQNLNTVRQAMEEARLFLGEPRHSQAPQPAGELAGADRTQTAQRLFSRGRPLPGTLAETYLNARSISAPLNWPALRFHPSCFYRAHEGTPLERWPALLAAVTDDRGQVIGLQRTYLTLDGSGKAPVDTPRRAMGRLLGGAVRFGAAAEVMAAGEGIETVLSLLSLFPAFPALAGLSAAHLAAVAFPSALRRLYVLRDNDVAGDFAEEQLAERCRVAGIDCRLLVPLRKDLNADLRRFTLESVRARMLAQLAPEDRVRFHDRSRPAGMSCCSG